MNTFSNRQSMFFLTIFLREIWVFDSAHKVVFVVVEGKWSIKRLYDYDDIDCKFIQVGVWWR